MLTPQLPLSSRYECHILYIHVISGFLRGDSHDRSAVSIAGVDALHFRPLNAEQSAVLVGNKPISAALSFAEATENGTVTSLPCGAIMFTCTGNPSRLMQRFGKLVSG